MEELVLDDPVVVTTTKYRVMTLILDMNFNGVISINLINDIGGTLNHQYLGQEAKDMMKWMNTANFSTNSMHKRILQKLTNDGVLDGTVQGTPDPPPAEF